jgi:hypothetical protein
MLTAKNWLVLSVSTMLADTVPLTVTKSHQPSNAMILQPPESDWHNHWWHREQTCMIILLMKALLFFGQCEDTLTHQPQSKPIQMYRVQDLTCHKNASDGNHKHKHEFRLLLDQAKTFTQLVCIYDVLQQDFFMNYVWLLSNIAAENKAHLTDSQCSGFIQVQLIDCLYTQIEFM